MKRLISLSLIVVFLLGCVATWDEIDDPFDMTASEVASILNRHGYHFVLASVGQQITYVHSFTGGVLVLDPDGPKNAKVKYIGVMIDMSGSGFLVPDFAELLRDLHFSFSFVNELIQWIGELPDRVDFRLVKEFVGEYFVLSSIDSASGYWVVMIGE